MWLVATAGWAQDVCLSGCPHTTVQSAVDAIPPGGFGIVTVASGWWSDAIRIDQGRSIVLTVGGLDPVTLSAEAPDEAVLTVDGASVDIVGLVFDAQSTRAIDAVDADVSISLSQLAGSGVVSGDGGLVRLVRSSFTGSLLVMAGGYAVGTGGLLSAVDSDVSLSLSELLGGIGGTGGALYAWAGEPGHSVTLDAVEILDCTAIGDGGQVYVEGPLELSMVAAVLTGGNAANGGILAMGPGEPVVEAEVTDFTDGFAVISGGAVWIESGSFTFSTGALRDSRATFGGGLAIDPATGSAAVVDLRNGLLGANLSIFEGGGIHAPTGTIVMRDFTIGDNGTTDPDPDQGGGGMRITGDADVDLARVTFCGNGALNGAAVLVDTDRPLSWSNVRFLENLAGDDGGGLRIDPPATLDLRYANFLGNSSQFGRGAAISVYGGLTLDSALVGWSIGGIALYAGRAAEVTLGASTAWWANSSGDYQGLEPDGALFVDPRLVRYDVGSGCGAQQDWHSWYSPLRDTGPVELSDLDETRSDIGAYGGPDADASLWTVDEDEDGFPVVYDCDDDDVSVNPTIVEEPVYDGIDSNCDLYDDYDFDQDGYRPPAYGGPDCDDLDPLVYPGAEEHAGEGIDRNCDQRLDADGDGWEPPADCDDADAEVHPGAVDDDPARDVDCDGFFDESRTLVPRGCVHGGGAGGVLVLVALGLPRRVRQPRISSEEPPHDRRRSAR